ncbi:MAG: ABC transporter ATP-binding protein [Clostridia bacterium]
MKNQNKKYTTISNMLFCLKSTKEYLPKLLVWTFLSIIVQLALPIIEIYLPKIIIDELTNNDSLQPLLLVVLISTSLFAVFTAFSKLCDKYVYNNKVQMGSYYIHKVSQKNLSTDYTNYQNEDFLSLQQESYDMCGRNESVLINIYYIWITLLSSTLGFIVYTSILANLNFLIVIFLIISSLAIYFLNKPITNWTEKNNAQRAKYSHKLGYIDSVSSDIKSAKDIRLYGMAEHLKEIYNQNVLKIEIWYKKYSKLILKVVFANSSISLLREGIAYAYLIYITLNSEISVGQFVLYFSAITGFSTWLQNIITQFTQMNRTSMHISKFRNYLEFDENFKRENGININDKLSSPCTIEIKNVKYKYPNSDNLILDDMSLNIKKGEHLGIIGLNGAGKTTLVNLICGLTDPTQGEILYDKINIKDYNRSDYYKLFSAVFQNYSLLALSIEEVIAETTTENIDKNKLAECLKIAGIYERILSLPNGVKTKIDKSVNDNATDFSGGEIQKLLLARAIYKNSPILILDEPTAALDPIAENKLYNSYHEITKGKTSIFISHRLASTRFCDRIILINNGKIEEMGTHTELLANKAMYYDLFETQATYYRESVVDNNE